MTKQQYKKRRWGIFAVHYAMSGIWGLLVAASVDTPIELIVYAGLGLACLIVISLFILGVLREQYELERAFEDNSSEVKKDGTV